HALVADGKTPTEFALMANNENKVFDNSLCSIECRKNTESLNNKIDELKNDLYEANIYRHCYKLGIDQLEGRLAEYKEREVKYIETIRTLKMDKEYNLGKIKKLTSEVETLQEEKDVVDGKLAHLLKSSKDLENIIECQSTSSEDQNKDTSTSEEGQLINSAEGTFLHWQWQNSSSSGNYFALPVGTSSGSGNFLLVVGTSSGSGNTSLEVGNCTRSRNGSDI
nr:hypothetical protein [Tanacetum cinerariifolium]